MVTDFIFDGHALSDYGYILFLEDEEDVEVSNMSFVTIKGARTDASQSVGHTYGDPYTTTFTIMKNPCVYDNDEQYLTRDDISEMVRWLCRKQYKWFRFIDDNNDNDEIWYKTQVKVYKVNAGDYCYGLKLIVTADAPFGYTREITTTFTGVEDRQTIEVPIITDEYGIFYPDVHINMGSTNGFFVFISNDTSRELGYGYNQMCMSGCENNEQIDFYGNGVMQFTSTNENHNFENDFNYKFPALISAPGITKNTLYIDAWQNSRIDITFKYRGIRKVGFE